ncbi:hypothetical protein [Burkholderia guangdongensis]|uniref:hypothetical protein n=1 Tax=Burkholderia guangdongensis TaxID=1792500 RepID=UPI0015C9D0A5|nr:hypothetical protein [Burkholderia guangdongensis]
MNRLDGGPRSPDVGRRGDARAPVAAAKSARPVFAAAGGGSSARVFSLFSHLSAAPRET